MNCESVTTTTAYYYYLYLLLLPLPMLLLLLLLLSLLDTVVFQDQFPHRSSGSSTGVGSNSDSVWGFEPECWQFSRLQQAKESSRAAGKSLHATVWF